MRNHFPRILALALTVLCCAPPVRAADPQPYRVDMAATGNPAQDEILHASSDLVTLRSQAPVSPFGLIARARGDIDRLKTALESFGYYQSSVAIKINCPGAHRPGARGSPGGAAGAQRGRGCGRFRARPALSCAHGHHRRRAAGLGAEPPAA